MRRAAIYARISSNDFEDRPDDRGVDRQEREGRRHAEGRGYAVVDVFVDNDLGASSRSRAKARPAWAAMIERVKSGDVDVIVARDLDRLTRRVRELEDIVELVEQTVVVVDLYSSGELDLTSSSGRVLARILGSLAAAESDKIGERVSAQRADRARLGRPVVAVDGFGWRAGVPVPDEAAAIVDGARTVVSGASLESIARDWQQAQERQGCAGADRGVRRHMDVEPGGRAGVSGDDSWASSSQGRRCSGCDARTSRRQRRAGLHRDDDRSPSRASPRVEAHGVHVPAL